ncbi:hypothetical protein [Streptomyces vastus]|uniref:APAF-1 helical domain-containing protein n=1 Tax=Streptomyces vastus TaxID=285451 RepID=A0ABN3R1Q3_9ACTN
MPLLRRAGHWPLALVMLSGILRSLVSRHSMTTADAVTALVGELDGHGIATLDELSDADVVRGISRTLELSLTDLGAAGRDRLVSLAAFPEGEVVPYWLLERLWGLSGVRVRTESDRFSDRSLVSPQLASGLRLHDVTREALRHMEPEEMTAVSARVLDRMRPAGGWHCLEEGEHSFVAGLAFHLRQAGRVEELGALLRDMRFLAVRLTEFGPPSLEADLELYAAAEPGDGYARALLELVRREGHLFAGGGERVPDVVLTLESRLAGRATLLEEIRNVEEARPARGLCPCTRCLITTMTRCCGR